MIRLSDYIADFLVKHGVTDVFTVTGGGAMYMNDSFGHCSKLHCTYNHHEQASAMAAEAYARIDNKPAVVCVTTGPGATNAITGVVCAYMDSIPMLVFSGQARYATTVYASGLKLRTRGVQEFDIIGSVKNMTKYCELVSDPGRIKYCLERALATAVQGRPGPCWLDIPLDVQNAMIDPDTLEGYTDDYSEKAVSDQTVDEIIEKIRKSKRPVIFVGNGVRLANAHTEFLKLVNKLNIPIVTGMSSVDAIETAHPLYVGRGGTTGNRAGNFAIQNSDLLLSLGSRLSYFQTGFNYESWARNAYKIVNDIDENELEKDSIHADMKLCCNAKDLICKLLDRTETLPEKSVWTEQCRKWKEKYPVVLQRHYDDVHTNIYAFYNELTKQMTENSLLVASVGTSRVVGSQASIIHDGMRFITNPSTASMGYDLPAAIGVCVSAGNRRTVLVTGDGSFQMNIQELQTIIHNKLPIVIFVMNNSGYHSIRMTQHTYFKEPLVGVGYDSGDLSFPDLSKIADAYGYRYELINSNSELTAKIKQTFDGTLPCICEVKLSTTQITEPKAASKRTSDGKMVSAPLEDMAPFLSRDELSENMFIPTTEEEFR